MNYELSILQPATRGRFKSFGFFKGADTASVNLHYIWTFFSALTSAAFRWNCTWRRSLSVMATLPTTPYTRTWWKIFLPKKTRTKMVSYLPGSLPTNTMNSERASRSAAPIHVAFISTVFTSFRWQLCLCDNGTCEVVCAACDSSNPWCCLWQ